MDHPTGQFPMDHRGSLRVVPRLLLAFAIAVPLIVSGCSGAPATGSTAGDPGASGHRASPTGAMAHGDMPPADADTAWLGRPAYVSKAARTEAAYAYALYNPNVLNWLPCYCGCAGMGHKSNRDCFVQRPQAGRPTAFEEHGSYCDVCVDIALTAKAMLAQGSSLLEVRQAIDAEFGGLAPGTDTPMPAA